MLFCVFFITFAIYFCLTHQNNYSMFRKIFLSLAILSVAVVIEAQNLQLHFDPPRHSFYGDEVAPVNYLTATFEMFKPTGGGEYFYVCGL